MHLGKNTVDDTSLQARILRWFATPEQRARIEAGRTAYVTIPIIPFIAEIEVKIKAVNEDEEAA